MFLWLFCRDDITKSRTAWWCYTNEVRSIKRGYEKTSADKQGADKYLYRRRKRTRKICVHKNTWMGVYVRVRVFTLNKRVLLFVLLVPHTKKSCRNTGAEGVRGDSENRRARQTKSAGEKRDTHTIGVCVLSNNLCRREKQRYYRKITCSLKHRVYQRTTRWQCSKTTRYSNSNSKSKREKEGRTERERERERCVRTL